MHVGIKPRQRDELKNGSGSRKTTSATGSLRFLERDEVAQWVASKRTCGLLDASRPLHPLKFTLGPRRRRQAAGVRLYENSRVRPSSAAGRHGRTEKCSVRAKHVALAATSVTAHSRPRSRADHIGIASISSRRGRSASSAAGALRDDIAVADVNWIIDYFRLSSDQRLLFGGRVSYSGIDPIGTARATRQRMLNVFPQLADVEIDYAWGGIIDISMSRAPSFGRLEPNVYYLQGFSGHGMSLTGIGGKIVAEAIAGQAERFDIYARLKHHAFPGGKLFRRPTLVLAMTWFRMRDFLP